MNNEDLAVKLMAVVRSVFALCFVPFAVCAVVGIAASMSVESRVLAILEGAGFSDAARARPVRLQHWTQTMFVLVLASGPLVLWWMWLSGEALHWSRRCRVAVALVGGVVALAVFATFMVTIIIQPSTPDVLTTQHDAIERFNQGVCTAWCAREKRGVSCGSTASSTFDDAVRFASDAVGPLCEHALVRPDGSRIWTPVANNSEVADPFHEFVNETTLLVAAPSDSELALVRTMQTLGLLYGLMTPMTVVSIAVVFDAKTRDLGKYVKA